MATYPKTPDALRKRLESRLGPIPDRHWQIASRRSLVDDVLFERGAEREEVEKYLVGFLRDLREAGQTTLARPPASRADRTRSPSFEAAVGVAAIEANDRGDVIAFRRRHLPAGPLDPAEVGDVLRAWAEAQGDVQVYRIHRRLEVAGPARQTLAGIREVAESARRRPGDDARIELAWIAAPGEPSRFPVGPDGPLADLERLAGRLAGDLGWPQDAAVFLVLTGRVPTVAAAQAVIRWGASACAARITVEAHPALTGRQVARIFERGRADAGARKPVGDAAAQMAVFAVERNDGRGWPEVAAEWQRRHKGTGGDWRAIRRQATRAYRHLTGRDLVWNGRKGRPRSRRRTLPPASAH